MDRYRYGLRQITPSDECALTLAEARVNCSIDDDSHDTTLAELIQQARNYLEEQTDACLLTSTWEWTFDRFPRCARPLVIPRWPVQAIESITYVDSSGTSQTMDDASFVLRVDDLGRSRLAPSNWSNWPVTKHTPDAVKIRFIAGWDDPANIPAAWQRAQLMLVAWWFEQREAGVLGVASGKPPFGVDDLIQSLAVTDDFAEFDLG